MPEEEALVKLRQAITVWTGTEATQVEKYRIHNHHVSEKTAYCTLYSPSRKVPLLTGYQQLRNFRFLHSRHQG